MAIPAQAQSIRFADFSEAAGIRTSGGSHGIAVHDYDGDGWDDFYLAASNGRSALFRNNGDATFEDVTISAGVTVAGFAVNPIWGDLNNDGFADLFVGTRGDGHQSALFLNDGQGSFVEVSEASGVDMNMSVGSAVFGDYDGDGLLDLFLATRDAHDVLYRNTGRPDTMFVDETGTAGVGGLDFSVAMQATWNDYDRDGDLDLFAVHDGNLTGRLYQQKQGYPRFSNVTNAAGIEVARSAMGVSWGDFDNDGWPDAYITNIDQGNLFRNLGDGTFEDVTLQTGAGLNGMSWGVVFADFDNDGDEDIYIGNTFGYDRRKSFLYENRDGLFVNVAEQAGVALSTDTYGVAASDFNRDGLVDLVIADERGDNRLLINTSEGVGNWIALELSAATMNTTAIDARVKVVANDQAYYRTVSGGASYLSQVSNVIHVGVGQATEVDSVIIDWQPSNQQIVTALPANTRYQIFEGGAVNVNAEASDILVDHIIKVQSYPNPFHARTNIAFQLATSQHVTLQVFDGIGREIRLAINTVKAAGRHVVSLDTQDWPAGPYLYRLSTPQQSVSNLMLLVK